MDRRDFLEITASTLAAGALASCAHPSAAPAPRTPIDARAFHTGRRFVETSFGRIACFEQGRGDAALFVHGYPLNGFQWRGAIERLATHRRCVAVDLLGLGYSEVPSTQSVAPVAQVAMLAELLDRLSIDAVDLIGNDSGGAVSQLFMLQHTHRVRTLLLTNCDVQDDSPPPSFRPFIALAKAGRLADLSIVPVLANKALARTPKGIGGLAYTYPTDPTDEAIDVYFTPLVGSPLRKAQYNAYAVALEANPLADTEAALRQCEVPARIVWGTGDTVFAQSSADWLDRVLPRSQGVRRVEGAKLFFPEEMPDIIAEEARRLWRV